MIKVIRRYYMFNFGNFLSGENWALAPEQHEREECDTVRAYLDIARKQLTHSNNPVAQVIFKTPNSLHYNIHEAILKQRQNSPIEVYINSRKSERGLTTKGELWIRQTLPRFEQYVLSKGISLLDVNRDDIRAFLSSVNGIWHRHSHFRAIRAFYNWALRDGYLSQSPCHGLNAPKVPKKILPRPNISEILKLIEVTNKVRDKAIISLFFDTGMRLNELANIKLVNINWNNNTIRVWGKGGKERLIKFGDKSATYLRQYLDNNINQKGNTWSLNPSGISIMLRRLERKTGIKCNPHSFRHAWAIESIKHGVNLLDVQVLGGWDSLEMVKHYAQEINSEDAITRYKPLLDI